MVSIVAFQRLVNIVACHVAYLLGFLGKYLPIAAAAHAHIPQ